MLPGITKSLDSRKYFAGIKTLKGINDRRFYFKHMDVGIFYSLHNISMHLIYVKDSLFYPFNHPTN